MKLTKQKKKEFIKDEKKGSKTYAKYKGKAFHKMSNDEKRHAKILLMMKTK